MNLAGVCSAETEFHGRARSGPSDPRPSAPAPDLETPRAQRSWIAPDQPQDSPAQSTVRRSSGAVERLAAKRMVVCPRCHFYTGLAPKRIAPLTPRRPRSPPSQRRATQATLWARSPCKEHTRERRRLRGHSGALAQGERYRPRRGCCCRGSPYSTQATLLPYIESKLACAVRTSPITLTCRCPSCVGPKPTTLIPSSLQR